MDNSSLDTQFPAAFGTSPDDFLRQYESLIYKIIYEQTRENPKFEVEDLFQEFFIHIAEDNFKRLRSFRLDCKPTTYLGKVLRNFLCDQYRKKGARVPLGSLEEIGEENKQIILGPSLDPEDIFSGELIQEAFKETFSRLTNREKLIFDLSTDKEMPAKEISELLKIKVKSVYKNNEKVKKILKDELKKRGMNRG